MREKPLRRAAARDVTLGGYGVETCVCFPNNSASLEIL